MKTKLVVSAALFAQICLLASPNLITNSIAVILCVVVCGLVLFRTDREIDYETEIMATIRARGKGLTRNEINTAMTWPAARMIRRALTKLYAEGKLRVNTNTEEWEINAPQDHTAAARDGGSDQDGR